MKFISFILFVSVIINTTGCTDLSSVEHLSKASEHINKSDVSSAIIELKNAIKIDPSNTEARILLATTYESIGDFSSAEKEFKKTIELDPSKTESIAISFGKVLYLLGERAALHELVVSQQKSSPDIYSALLIYDALAKFDDGKSEEASVLVEKAILAVESSSYTQLGLAMQASRASDYKKALEISSELIKADSSLSDAWILHGQLLLITGDTVLAEDAFKAFVELRPQFEQAKIYYAYTLIKNKKYQEAEGITEKLLKIFPNQPIVNQLYGYSKFYQNDFELGFLHVEKSIQLGQRTNSNLLVAGIAAFRLAKYETAYRYFRPIKNELNSSREMRQVVAFVEFKLGHNSDVIDSLSSIEKPTEAELDLLSTAGLNLSGSSNKKEIQKSIESLNSASTLSPDLLMKRGLLKLLISDVDGLDDLENSISDSDVNIIAEKTLAASYLKNDQLEKLFSLAQNLQKKYPQKAIGYNFEALGEIKRQNIEAGHKLYEKSLSIEPGDITANIYMAHQHYQNLKLELANKHIQNILELRPTHIPTLALMHMIEDFAGRGKESANKISQLADDNKDNDDLKILAARALYNAGEYELSVRYLDELKNSPLTLMNQYWTLKIAVNNYVKNKETADTIFDNWIASDRENFTPWRLKIQFLESSRRYVDAIKAIEKVGRIFPNEESLQLIEVQLLILNQQIPEALNIYNSLSDKLMSSDYGIGLKGQFSFANKKYTQALDELTLSYNASPKSRLALTIYQTYINLKNEDAGVKFLSQHVLSHPRDEVVTMMLASIFLSSAPKNSLALYKRALAVNPSNIIAINNIAYLSYEENDLVSANSFVDKALGLDSKDMNILDTAVTIKIASKQYNKAVELLNQMYNMSGDIAYKEKAKNLEGK